MTTPEATNYKFCQDTLEMKKSAELAFLVLGERLYKIREEQLYRGSWDSFQEYLEEFRWQPSTVSRLIGIYQKLVLEYKMPKEEIAAAGGWTVIGEILPLINSKEDAVEWLNKTKEHSRADIRKDIKEAKGTLPEQKVPGCKHPPDRCRYIKICDVCGHSEQVYPNDKLRLFSKPHTH